jgi:hypothetical protein
MMEELHEKYQRYSNIKYCVAVSCKTNRYIEKLKDLIISIGSADAKMKETYLRYCVLYYYFIVVSKYSVIFRFYIFIFMTT